MQDRVKQALKQQELEETSGERRKRKSSSSNAKESAENEKTEKSVESSKEEVVKDEKPKVKKKPAVPSVMSFSELLKIAEKKQHEPVMVEVKPKVEEERPMTKRQKKEYMQEKERREQREKRELELLRGNNVTSATSGASNKPPQAVNKPPKTVAVAAEKSTTSNSISMSKGVSSHTASGAASVTRKLGEHGAEKSGFKSAIKNNHQHELLEERRRLDAERKQLELDRRKLEEERRQLERSKREEDARSQSSNKMMAVRPKIDKPALKDIKPRQFPPADLKPSSLANAKPRQFPPTDLRPVKASKPLVKKPPPTKRKFDSRIVLY